MDKFLLASVLLVPFLIARQAASIRRARAALWRVLVLSTAFEILYVLAVAFLYFRVAR
jgi:hypothetical protein